MDGAPSLAEEIAELRSQGYGVFDMHAHSLRSDGFRSPEALVRRAHDLGLSGIVVTDHDCVDGYERARREAERYGDGFLVVPASEVSSASGHVLAYGVTERLPPDLSLGETAERIHAQGGLAVAAHPYASLGTGDPFRFDELEEAELALLDGVEVYNSSILFPDDANALASELADRYGLARVGGSDSHLAWSLGSGITVMPEVGSVDELLDAIRSRRTEAYRPAMNDRRSTTARRWFDYVAGALPRLALYLASQVRARRPADGGGAEG